MLLYCIYYGIGWDIIVFTSCVCCIVGSYYFVPVCGNILPVV